MAHYWKSSLPPQIALVTLHLLLLYSSHYYYVIDATTDSFSSKREVPTLDSRSINLSRADQLCNSAATSNSRILKNASLCKPCVCDPTGSESQLCDQLTRRCLCRPGYTGNRCDKCSYGYYNLTIATNMDDDNFGATSRNNQSVERENGRQWRCNSCGPCFDTWQQNLTALKREAVTMVTRVSELAGTFVDHLGLDPVTEKLVLKKDGTSLLASLDNSIKIVGEKILGNKQASDRINLLNSELNSTALFINEIQNEAAIRVTDTNKLETVLSRLNYQINLQSDQQRHLSRLTSDFSDQVLEVQEFIPAGAVRLIRKNCNRTQKALSYILEHHNKEVSPRLDGSLSSLERKLNRVRYSKRQLAHIGTKILEETLTHHALEPLKQWTQANSSSFYLDVLSLLTSQGGLENHSSSSKNLQAIIGQIPTATELVAETADTITELNTQHFDSYQANFDNRTADMSAARKQIEETKAILLEANQLMSTFDSNLTDINSIVTALNGTDSCNYEQLVENATHIIRASLDKIDVRLPAVQMELAELTIKSRAVNDTTRMLFANLSLEINEALTDNLSSLKAFRLANAESDLSDVASMKNRTRQLARDLDELARKLIKLADLKQTIADLKDNTVRINSNVTLELDKSNRLMSDLTTDTYSEYMLRPQTITEQQLIATQSPIETFQASAKALTLQSRLALDRVRNHQAATFGRKLNIDKILNDKIENLTNSTAENKRLSQEVNDRLAELSLALQIIDVKSNITRTEVANVINNSTRLSKLRDKRRLANVISDIRQISMQLHRHLIGAQNLSSDFKMYEGNFTWQREKIDLLHSEMDVINSDLKKKSDYYENCPTS